MLLSSKLLTLFCAAFIVTRLVAQAAPESQASAAQLEFFESKVRPILVERCYECHSNEAKKSKGGLLLDTREGWQKGGDTGPAIIPGDVDKSLLIKAIRYNDEDLEMPPKKRLEASEVEALEAWVKMGAPDPRDGKAKAATSDDKAWKSHWAFQPITNPAPPENTDVSSVPLDRFVAAKLQENGLTASQPADKRTLVRRLYFDLLGLPPTYEEVEAFARDEAADAWPRLIDQLLARPEYGQRWGRYWLDVARYADTKDQSVDEERRFPFAYTYRDYVIDSFNDDKPFDRFVKEQVAADLLPDTHSRSLAALGFLTVGRKFKGNPDAENLILDDQIDVVTRGFLGLTVACARCHDHKFDPIPTADYYSLFGILGSSEEPMDLPEIGKSGSEEAIKAHLAERQKLFDEYEQNTDKAHASSNSHLLEHAGLYLEYIAKGLPKHRTTEGSIPFDTESAGLLLFGGPARWQKVLDRGAEVNDGFFSLWAKLAGLERENFNAQVQQLIGQLTATGAKVHPTFLSGLKQKTSMIEVAHLYGSIIKDAFASKGEQAAAIKESVAGTKSPLPISREEISVDLRRFVTARQLTHKENNGKAGGLRDKLDALETKSPIQRAMVFTKTAKPLDPKIFIRGNAGSLGQSVPRRAPKLLAEVDSREYTSDGRLEFAEALVNPKNSLTARVIVNRIWQHHFGEGIVPTPDNFGMLGAVPSHPELLDHLATWFMEHGWSIKALHRYILQSRTWMQASASRPDCLEKDPSNRLLWRMSPRRLEFEPLRDSLLAVAGELDVKRGGQSEPMSGPSKRRAVYGYADRFIVPALLRSFDVANPDTSISHRSESTVPQQALFMMNSPFVRDRAVGLLKRAEIASEADNGKRIRALYRAVLSREPDTVELGWTEAYVRDGAPGAPESDKRWTNLSQVLLLSNEFYFVK